MRSGRTVGAWALVVSVLAAWCLAAVTAWAGVAPSAGTPPDAVALGSPAQAAPQDRQVVLVGVPGLTWDLLTLDRAPGLTRLAQEGGTGALILRGTHEMTCAADAWLTLGAGQRAATDLPGCVDGDGSGGPVVLEDRVAEERWRAWRQAAASRALDPRLGSLAELAEASGTCVAAYGDAAVVGAARPDGSAASVLSADPGSLAPLEAVADGVRQAAGGGAGSLGAGGSTDAAGQPPDDLRCRVHLVAAPEVSPDGPADVLAEVDEAVGRLIAAVPAGTIVVVSGMGQATGDVQAQALLAIPAVEVGVGPYRGASLSSGSTRQRDLVQLTDLTPTVLVAAGVESWPGGVLAGQPVTATPVAGGPGRAAAELAAGVSAVKALAPVALAGLVALVLTVLLVGGGLLRVPAARRAGRVLVLGAATVALSVPVATWLAGLTRWWATDRPLAAVLGLVLAWAALVAATAWAGPWRGHPLGPPAWVAAVTLVVICVDVVWSARLGLVSLLGLQPVTAGRFFGQGNVGFGIILGSVLVLMATLLSWLRGRRGQAAAAVGLLGLAAAALNGAPQAGADFGGVPALVVATGLLLLHALGVRWTWWSVLAVIAAGVLAAGLVMVMDWLRGAQRRTHLGDFVQAALEGEAWGIVTRKLGQSLGILLAHPVAWLAVAGLVLLTVVVLHRPRWSERLWQHAGTHPTALAALPAAVLAWVLNDSGLPAMAICLAVLVAAGILVVGRHPATHRTALADTRPPAVTRPPGAAPAAGTGRTAHG